MYRKVARGIKRYQKVSRGVKRYQRVSRASTNVKSIMDIKSIIECIDNIIRRVRDMSITRCGHVRDMLDNYRVRQG